MTRLLLPRTGRSTKGILSNPCDSVRGFHLFRTAFSLRSPSNPPARTIRTRQLAVGALDDSVHSYRPIPSQTKNRRTRGVGRDLGPNWIWVLAMDCDAGLCFHGDRTPSVLLRSDRRQHGPDGIGENHLALSGRTADRISRPFLCQLPRIGYCHLSP